MTPESALDILTPGWTERRRMVLSRAASIIQDKYPGLIMTVGGAAFRGKLMSFGTDYIKIWTHIQCKGHDLTILKSQIAAIGRPG